MQHQIATVSLSSLCPFLLLGCPKKNLGALGND
jgi:hypothetical protein